MGHFLIAGTLCGVAAAQTPGALAHPALEVAAPQRDLDSCPEGVGDAPCRDSVAGDALHVLDDDADQRLAGLVSLDEDALVFSLR